MRGLALAVAGLVLAPMGTTAADVLTPSKLNADPRRYNDRTVVVRGYVVLVQEGHNLRDSKEIYDELAGAIESDAAKSDPSFNLRDYDKYCLTIANANFLYDHQEDYAGKTLVLRGKFVANYLGLDEIDLGACALPTGFYIDIDDLKKRYPPKTGP